MVEEIAFENGRISDFKGLVTLTLTLTLTLDRVILHTVVHHSSISIPTCQIALISNKLFTDGRTHIRTYVRTDGHLRPALLGRLCRRVDLIITIGQRILKRGCITVLSSSRRRIDSSDLDPV